MLSFSVDSISHGVAYCSDCQTYFFPEDSNEISSTSVDCSKCGAILLVYRKLVSDRSDQRFILEQCVREIMNLKNTILQCNQQISNMKSNYHSVMQQNISLEKLVLTKVTGIDNIQERQEKLEERQKELEKQHIEIKGQEFFLVNDI